MFCLSIDLLILKTVLRLPYKITVESLESLRSRIAKAISEIEFALEELEKKPKKVTKKSIVKTPATKTPATKKPATKKPADKKPAKKAVTKTKK